MAPINCERLQSFSKKVSDAKGLWQLSNKEHDDGIEPVGDRSKAASSKQINEVSIWQFKSNIPLTSFNSSKLNLAV